MIKSRGAKGSASVTFTLDPGVGARTAAVCGEWNDWSADADVMRRDAEGGFSVTVDLEAGRTYRFRYLLDGQRWDNDWAADAYLPNAFGGDDSVVDLTALAEAVPPAAKKAPVKKAAPARAARKAAAPAAKPARKTAKLEQARAGRATSMSSPGDFGLAADGADVERLVAGQHHDPHHLLGAHPVRDGEGRDRVVIRGWRPDAAGMVIVAGGQRIEMRRVHPAGVFAGALEGPDVPDYRLETYYPGEAGEVVVTADDPYRFWPTLGELDPRPASGCWSTGWPGTSPRMTACRRCGKITSSATVIWGADRTGALTPRAAECRGRCTTSTSPAPGRSTGQRPVVITAYRPGVCATCDLDIVPGAKIVFAGEGRYAHRECPAGDSHDGPSRAVTMTATRPGRCAECERDIIPGDVLAQAGGQSYHYECAPADPPAKERRTRTRARS